MGIRTIGFEKTSRKASKEKSPIEVKTEETKEKVTTPKGEDKANVPTRAQNKKESNSKNSILANDKPLVKEATPKRVAASNSGETSPSKVRTTPASMARLGGIKAAVAARKKQRKRRLFVRSTKILRSSIKPSRPRRTFRSEGNPSKENKTVNATTSSAPSRFSARMCMRRYSREGIPEGPLRTVELIKRPVELQDAATKLLYCAALGLYPTTEDSDTTEIVVIKEFAPSPGKKNGVKKSLELPLVPFRKRLVDHSSSAKRELSENVKPVAKQAKRDNRKTSPTLSKAEIAAPKKLGSEKSDKTKPVSTVTTSSKAVQLLDAVSLVANNYTKAIMESSKNKSLVNGIPKSLDLTITPGNVLTTTAASSSRILHDIGKTQSSTKSLLKTNLSPPPTSGKKDISYNGTQNFIPHMPVKQTTNKSSTFSSSTVTTPSHVFNVANAMNLLMSSITILPTNSSAVANQNQATMKRPATSILSTNSKLMEASSTTNGVSFNVSDEMPPKKKQKVITKVNSGRLSLPNSITIKPASCQKSNTFTQPIQSENTEALNLCVKRNSDPPITVVCPPPKLQNKSNVKNDGKGAVDGQKPLNLIIPRPPPPLTKAPLELANFSQNVYSIQSVRPKSQPKKAKKARSNYNQRNQSLMQLPLLPQLTTHLPAVTESVVQAKSLLKTVNGEENACVRELGEQPPPMDSVKTMLARLQTRIGPAVNGVRLITIE